MQDKLANHPQEVCERPRVHLSHHVSAVNFDGDFADTKCCGDLFIQLSSDYETQDLALSQGQGLIVLAGFGVAGFPMLMIAIPFNPGSDGVEQILISKRFGEELNRAGLHGADRHRNIAVRRDEDYRQDVLSADQLFLQVQSTQPRKPDIADEASGSARPGALQKSLRRGKSAHLESN